MEKTQIRPIYHLVIESTILCAQLPQDDLFDEFQALQVKVDHNFVEVCAQPIIPNFKLPRQN